MNTEKNILHQDMTLEEQEDFLKEKQEEQLKKSKCLKIRSKAILEPDCLLPNGTWQRQCLGCEFYVKNN